MHATGHRMRERDIDWGYSRASQRAMCDRCARSVVLITPENPRGTPLL